MPAVETNTRKIIGRLEREGWVNVGGGSHDKFKHDARPRVIHRGPAPSDAVAGRCAIHRQVGRLELIGASR
jgi:predicted RNA binding protein YcfA (HicA-like mRNA interferase family)